MKRPAISMTVFWLGAVSFFTDASSEMIYPLLPVFLTTVLGASVISLGIIEGAAGSTAALLKIFAGGLSDRWRRRKPLMLFGYGLAAVLRPLIAFSHGAGTVFCIRIGDRLGKGVRGSPRDALVADVTPKELRGRAYGVQRAMDNAGAVLGPLLAFGLIEWGLPLRRVFLLAAIPGAVAVLILIFLVKERPRAAPAPQVSPTPASPDPATDAAPLPAGLRRYYLALGFFSLGNSSDTFLILWARDAGLSAAHVPLLWMLHNGIKAVFNTPLGSLSDRIGRRRVILTGWAVYAAVYLGFAFLHSPRSVWILFAAYSFYYAMTEGAASAMVADLAPATSRGRAFGWYSGIIGACALPASLLCSELYTLGQARGPHGGPLWAFSAGAAFAAAAALVLLTVPESKSGKGSAPAHS